MQLNYGCRIYCSIIVINDKKIKLQIWDSVVLELSRRRYILVILSRHVSIEGQQYPISK